MKLFLASYRFGAHADRLVELTGPPGRIAVVANAADAWPPSARSSAVDSELRGLRGLGFDPYELDFRRFFGRSDALAAELDSVDALWVRGGNTFVLRSQLARAGAEAAIVSRVESDRLTFAGYSAGACIAAPSLTGVEAADDPAEVHAVGGVVEWSGLGLVGRAIVPHVDSPLDEAGAAQVMIERYTRDEVPFAPLNDDQAIVVDGDRYERI